MILTMIDMPKATKAETVISVPVTWGKLELEFESRAELSEERKDMLIKALSYAISFEGPFHSEITERHAAGRFPRIVVSRSEGPEYVPPGSDGSGNVLLIPNTDLIFASQSRLSRLVAHDPMAE